MFHNSSVLFCMVNVTENFMKANMQTFYAHCYFTQAGDIHKKKPTTGDKEEVEPFAIYDTDLESHQKGRDSIPIVDVTYIEAETHEIC